MSYYNMKKPHKESEDILNAVEEYNHNNFSQLDGIKEEKNEDENTLNSNREKDNKVINQINTINHYNTINNY